MGLRVAAGVATPEEASALAAAPLLVGPTGGLVVLRKLPPDQWVAVYGRPRTERPDVPPPAHPGESGRARADDDVAQATDDGHVLLAHPDREPPPARKPGYRSGRARRG